MKVESYKAGMPSWTDLATTDEAGALEFYSNLFGWEDEPNEAGEGVYYHMQRLGEDYVSAITSLQPQEAEQGIPPHWNTYITVDDLEATVAKVPEAGGQVFAEPFDVMDAGRMAVVADPTGGMVNLWQAKQHVGAGLRNQPNSIGWQELMTTDVAKAAAFFSDLFEVEVVEAPGTEGQPYTLLQIDGQPIAGLLQITPEMGEMPTNWLTYFQVEDLEQASAKAQSLGGQPQGPSMEAPGMKFAVLRDPQGAVFALVEPQEEGNGAS